MSDRQLKLLLTNHEEETQNEYYFVENKTSMTIDIIYAIAATCGINVVLGLIYIFTTMVLHTPIHIHGYIEHWGREILIIMTIITPILVIMVCRSWEKTYYKNYVENCLNDPDCPYIITRRYKYIHHRKNTWIGIGASKHFNDVILPEELGRNIKWSAKLDRYIIPLHKTE